MIKAKKRQGVVAVILCILFVPLLILLAFSIDYGYLLFIRTDLQRGVDQAVLAAARDLTPDAHGIQDLDQVRARVREYVALNLGDDFTVADDDIEIGKYDPDTIYGDLEILGTGPFDTVRVTVRRNDETTSSVSLYFARLFGRTHADVAAVSTALLPPAKLLGPGTGVLPFGINKTWWDQVDYGDVVTIYGSGRITSNGFDSDSFASSNSSGNGVGNSARFYGGGNGNGNSGGGNGNSGGGNGTSTVAGNWGTLDIGPTSNSTADLKYQILNGLSQSDLDSLYQQGVIPTNEYIDTSLDVDLNGDTGLSAGIKHALEDIIGHTRIAPIYSSHVGHGGNLEFHVTGWVSVTMVDADFNGANNSKVEVQKSYLYDEHLRPATDLASPGEVIEGAYTAPILIQ